MTIEIFNQTAMLLGAALVSITILVYSLVQNRTSRQQNRLFLGLVLNVMIASIATIIRYYAAPYAPDSEIATITIKISHLVYYALHNILAMMFGIYVTKVNSSWVRMKVWMYYLYVTPCAILEILILTNPMHQMFFYYDAQMNVYRNFMVLPMYAVSIGYILFALTNLMFHWSAITKKRQISLVFYFGLVFAGMIIQMINSNIKTELLTEALALIGVMLFIEKEDDRIDLTCGIYNRAAMVQDIRNYMRMGQKIQVICIRLTNHDLILRLAGEGSLDTLNRTVSKYFKECCPWYEIYHATPVCFMIVNTGTPEDAVALSEKIYVRFINGLYMPGAETPINATILRASVPEELVSVSDVLLMCDASLPEKQQKGIVCGKRLAYLRRNSDVEEAITRGLRERNFEIFYQTVHRTEDLLPFAVKALVRLKDPILGDVMPGEFIPQAERTGQIHELGNLILEEVCDFIRSGLPARLGLECINVNLSFVQCMQPGFTERVKNIVESHHIRSSMLNFEITKPVNKEDYEILDHVIRDLKKEGFLFSMEDFGAGYSNVESVLSLDFDVVKIDKSILWAAAESEVGRIVLSSSIRMIRDLNRRILVEGVENESQIKLLTELGADYLQGFYFSKPVSRETLEANGIG